MDAFLAGFAALTIKQVIMLGIGGILLYLAIAKQYEPALLLPMGFGAIMVNIPLSAAVTICSTGKCRKGP